MSAAPARDRCPTCRGLVPPLKTCANEACRAEFYRSEGGRSDALYCSRRCAVAHATRAYRLRLAARDISAGDERITT